MYAKEEMAEFENLEPLASLVKRLGNPESTTLLHSPCHIFALPHIDGAIAYEMIGNCAVVVGDPICLPKDVEELVKAFQLHCKNAHLKVVYLLVYHDFAHTLLKHGCQTLIEVGEELSINPIKFRQRQKLRWKVNQAIQQGVSVKEYTNFDPILENQMKHVINAWSMQRKGPQIHLGKINFFDSQAVKRILYAEQNGQIVGLLMLTPVDLYHGWVVSTYFAMSNAPVGTTEHLLCSTYEMLASENCHFLCLGAVSLKKLGEVVGLSPVTKYFAELIIKMARMIFKLDSKAIYLKKFNPASRSTFLVCKDKLTIKQLLAIKQILNVKL